MGWLIPLSLFVLACWAGGRNNEKWDRREHHAACAVARKKAQR